MENSKFLNTEVLLSEADLNDIREYCTFELFLLESILLHYIFLCGKWLMMAENADKPNQIANESHRKHVRNTYSYIPLK